jgi:gliding motility-associated-like protein
MTLQTKRIIILFELFCLPSQAVFPQSYSSKDNYTGAWETPASWDPTWTVPQTTIVEGGDFVINGYITVNGSLSFITLASNLIINDTLVIKGDLILGSLNNLTINGNGILIIRGNLRLESNPTIITNNYIVITGYIWKTSSPNNGSFVSNSNPTKVFVGAYVYPASLTNKPNFPALNCNAPTTTPYPHSNCSYGDMTDILNDPIYTFFQSTCTIATPTITASGPTTFCSGGNVTLTSSAGTSYLWSTGATTASINVSTAGSYTVRVTNASGCQSAASAATIVTVNALPATPTITDGGPTVFCTGDSVSLTSSAGTSYLWSTGATTESINVTASGNYTVKVTDTIGCRSAASAATGVTVNALPITPTITAGGPTAFCPGGNVTLTSNAGTSYLWSTGATTASINVTAAGSYSVRVTNASGCLSAASVAIIVTVNTLPVTPTITAGGPTTYCAGGSVTLTSSAGTSYLWSTGATTASINVTASGSYTVQVTDANGCQSAVSAATAVTGNDLPETPTITAGGPTAFCTGGSVTLTSSAGTGYLWSTGETNASINVSTSGNYTVRVTNASGCPSAASAATVVTVNALPVTPTITAGGPMAFCAGGSVTLTSSAGTSYLWSNAATTPNINVTTAGSYTVQVINASGCQSAASVPIIVTVNALPAAPTITAGGPITFCAGGSVTLTSSAEASYLWSNAATTPNINVTTAGSYAVQVTDANGCQSAASVTTVVNVNALPVVNAGTDTTIQNGTSTIINATVTGAGPFTYSWSPSEKLLNALEEDPTTVNLTSSTVFILTATSTTSSCSSTNAVTITIIGVPLSSSPATSSETVCAGSNVQLNALASGGSGFYTYTWTSTPAGFTSSVADPIANPTVNTTYNVIVFDGFTTVISEVIVTVNALPSTPTITAGGPTTFCAGDSVTLTSSTGTSYLWSTGATSDSINITASGSYTVRVTNASGCYSAASAATIVTVNALPVTPTITAGGPTAFCAGGSVTLTSSTGTNYLWSNAATIQNNNVTSSGSYTVQITNASGCRSAASVATIVTVNAFPVTPTITADGPTTICADGSVTLTSSAEAIYLWSNAATTPNINVTSAGSYTVRVTNASGCQSAASAAIVVTVNALPETPIITAGGPTVFCTGGSVTLTSSAGTSNLWSTGATTASINVNTSGSYTVRVTNASGCMSAASAATIVTVNALPLTPTITAGGPTAFCTGGNVTLTSSAGTSYLWSTGATTDSINVTASGNYSVQVTNAGGCQSAPSVATIVTVNAFPVTPAITPGGPIALCAGRSVTLTSSEETSYLWSTGATTANIDVTTAGSYTVRVTNASGCMSAASAAIIVTVNELPITPTIIAGGPTAFCTGGSVTLTSSAGTSYLWSTGVTTTSINITASGSYTVRVTDASGCMSAASAAIIVTVNELPITPTIIAGGPTAFCTGGSVTLSSSPGTSYLWSTGATSDSINVTTSGSYTVRVTNASGCQSAAPAAIAVTVNALPVVTASNNGPAFSLKALDLIGGPEGMTTYSWTGPSGFTSNSQSPSVSASALAAMAGVYTLTVTNASGCSNTATTTVEVNELPIPSVITPNGDGKNDYFVIGEIIGQVELIIFNRWGNEEYKNRNYSNDWDGRNNKGADLPNDTYFYILKFKSGKIIKGSVLIKR